MEQFIVYTRAKKLYEAMLDTIENAKHSIYLEVYTIVDDEVGKKFSEIFIRKAQEGVRVTIVYDAFGCVSTPKKFFEVLKEHNVNVYVFNPLFLPSIQLYYIRRSHRRNHNKMLIVDDLYGFIGGMNIAVDYITDMCDIHVFMHKVMVEHLRDGANETLRIVKNMEYSSLHRALKKMKVLNESQNANENRFIRSVPSVKLQTIRDEYVNIIDSATSLIQISGGYFIPDKTLRYSLLQAVERGVKVEIFISQQSDKPIADYAGRCFFEDLLRSGVAIFWHPKILHAKCILADKKVCTIGSANFDYRSLRYNFESIISFQDTKVIAECVKFFERIQSCSSCISQKLWTRRSLRKKILEGWGFFWRKFL